MISVRPASFGIALLLMSSLGCNMMHNLQPHRLQRLNRGVEGMPTSAYFSVNDPLDEANGDRADVQLAVTELGK